MDSKIVGVMFGGKFGRVDPAQPLEIIFDQETCGDHSRVEVTQPDDRYAMRFIAANRLICFLGAPDQGTQRCFETRDSDARGPSESPMVVTYPNGMIGASVEYVQDAKRWFSCQLTVVEQ